MHKNLITNLPNMGLLKISGDGAKKLLQGQLTCNLDEIQPGKLQLAAHCNPQGRVISLFYLFLHENHYYLHMPRDLIPIAANALKKYAVFFKVTIEDVTNELFQLGLLGTSAPDDHNTIIQLAFPEAQPRFLLISNQASTQADVNIWHNHAIDLKIPAIYPETSEKFLPHELDLPKLHAISFNKGCYTGQEIIARMQYRGKLKKHLLRATVTGPVTIQRGGDIYSQGNTAGNIVDYCHLADNNYALLVIAQDDDAQTQSLSLDPAGTHTFFNIE